MRRVLYFYYFLLYWIYELVRKGGEPGSRFVACGLFGGLIYTNVVVTRDIVVRSGLIQSFDLLPYLGRNLLAYAVIGIYSILWYAILQFTGFLRNALSNGSKKTYSYFGFSGKYALVYVLVSLILLFALA